MMRSMFGIERRPMSSRRVLVPLQGTEIRLSVSRGIGRRWLPQPRAKVYRPDGPENHRVPNEGGVAKADCMNRNWPKGPEEPSEGLRPIRPMPWKIHAHPFPLHPERVLEPHDHL